MSGEHSISMQVRDYECDLQGVVNNAVYQHYLEHARHECLRACNVDFAALVKAGIHLVVVRAELDYLDSLTPDDRFTVRTRMEQVSRLRFAFHQEIVRDDGKAMLRAVVTGTGLNEKGRPHLPDELLQAMKKKEEQ